MEMKMSASFVLVVMFFIFMTLKLCGVIAWPWILVSTPLWVPIVAVLITAVVFSFFVKM